MQVYIYTCNLHICIINSFYHLILFLISSVKTDIPCQHFVKLLKTIMGVMRKRGFRFSAEEEEVKLR